MEALQLTPNAPEVDRFAASISEHNEASLGMFFKLGFVEIERCQVFHEVKLELCVDQQLRKKLEEANQDVVRTQYWL